MDRVSTHAYICSAFKSLTVILYLATDEQLKLFMPIFQKLQKLDPDFKGPITPEESVRLQLQVINGATVKDTGTFISQHGNKQWLWISNEPRRSLNTIDKS